MVFASDPFGLCTTNVRDKTFADKIRSYPRYLSREFLYLNQWIRFKSGFRLRELDCVKSQFSTKLNINESK